MDTISQTNGQKQVLTLAGKSKGVFRFLELLARFRGEVTLGQLAEPDPLEQERRADAYREYQDRQREWRGAQG